MKKLLSILLILSFALTLASCSNSDLPEGMQLVRGGEDVGYYFYAPEEWTLSNYGSISAAYASTVDTTSVSYTEVPEPAGTVLEYFTESLNEFPARPNVLTPDGEDTTFGNADSAKKFIFEHEYSGHKFRTMQIFVKYGERFGIFTYNAVLENVSSSEKVQYDYYAEKVQSVIDNFKFVAMSETEAEAPEVSDGYKLISDISVAKFSLYVPSTMTADETSGIVSASYGDGSNVTLSKATATGVVVSKYWETRKTELSAIVNSLTEIEINKEASLGNAKRAFSYEYTFVYNNTTYHVYQVLAVTTFDGFVFTYTATEDNYASHIDEVKTIIEKVEF